MFVGVCGLDTVVRGYYTRGESEPVAANRKLPPFLAWDGEPVGTSPASGVASLIWI